MIRFYIDGTTGQKDGTEVTSINPITATGLFPSGSTAASKSVKVYIRADAGESYRQVLVGVNADKFTKCRITSFNNSITQTIGLTGGYFETVLKTVSDVNQELTFTFYATASDGAIEDLNVKGMIRNHKLAKSIASVSWAKFFEMLEYKAIWYGNEIRRVPTMYPSSQTCSFCGCRNPLVKNLCIRIWECPKCHTVHDRDTNASINILKKGLQMQSA